MEKELVDKIKYLIKKKRTLDQICGDLKLNANEVIGLVTILRNSGELVDFVNGEIIRLNKEVTSGNELFIRDDSNVLKLLIVSDTHFGNKSDRPDIVNYLYDKADKEGIKYVLHGGDLTDGYYPNRPQQIYELKACGFDEQVDYTVKKYPHFEHTYFIGGNHDATHIRNGGGDICRAIAAQRSDMIYLGPESADLSIGKLKIHLHHGGGGRAYSRGYKLQRYAETLTIKKPNIVIQGHYHNSMYMNYMGMNCFQVGALLGETPFSRQMGFQNELSAWFVNVYMDDKGNPYSVEPREESFTKKLIRKRAQ